jgi:hypothetical protein
MLKLPAACTSSRFTRVLCKCTGYDTGPSSPARSLFVISSLVSRTNIASFLACCLSACSGGPTADESAQQLPLRIFHNPYRDTDWAGDQRLLAQHHDHTGLDLDKLRAYDQAGYAVVPLMDYSGAPSLSYALKTRLWPPESALPADFLASLQHIRVFLPDAEEVGDLSNHMTSPFLTTYIELWEPARNPVKQSWQYQTVTEMIGVVGRLGGLPIVAHPWNEGQSVQLGVSSFGVEIYSAFAEDRRRQGIGDFARRDHNQALLQYWDRVLQLNPAVVGLAVNDHFGPLPDQPTDPQVQDSGKIVVLVKDVSLDGYRAAFARGAILAVKDLGAIKGRYPAIETISLERTSILIDTPDSVRWIANGATVGSAGLLEFASIPSGSRYVRAEVSNADGSVVFTQAFALRPVGDANDDGRVDAQDRAVCDAVRAGAELNPDRIDACQT